MNRSSHRDSLKHHFGRTHAGKSSIFRSGRRPGQTSGGICVYCYRKDRIRFDLGVLTGYGANRGTVTHLRHIGRDLGEESTVGTYAEKMRAEFDATLTELNSIILAAKASKDTKTLFEAMRVKNDTLKAIGRALGLAPTFAASRTKRGQDRPEEAGRVVRDDVAAVVASAQAIGEFERDTATVNGGEVVGVGAETEGGEPG